MTAFTPGVTRVARTAGGVVTVGSPRPNNGLRPVVDLLGGSLTIDLESLDEVPVGRIADAEAAAWWLAHVYGESVAEAVLELAGDADTAPELLADIGVQPGRLAAPILRFAVGSWLHRWWPAGWTDNRFEEIGTERERWLETELGILAWYADQAFGGPEVAAELLADNLDYVVAFVSTSRDRLRPLAAARAVIESVALDDERYDEVSRHEQTLAEELRAVSDVDWLDRFELAVTSEMLGDDRGDRSRATGAAVAGRTTVDWSQVPPRVVSGAEDVVRWSVVPNPTSGSADVSVAVPVGPRWTGDARNAVHAVVFRNNRDEPDVLFELTRDARGSLLSGSAPCPPVEPGDRFRVGVFAPAWLDAEEPSFADGADRRRVVDRIREMLAAAPHADSDAAPYDLMPGEWPLPPLRATWATG